MTMPSASRQQSASRPASRPAPAPAPAPSSAPSMPINVSRPKSSSSSSNDFDIPDFLKRSRI